MKGISTAELIHSGEVIKDMKKVVGDNLKLKIYISPGNEPHTAWDDEAQKTSKPRQKRLKIGNIM